MSGPDVLESSPSDPRQAVEAVWRIESGRLLGALVRQVRDVDLAEELAQDALLAALERWPRDGVPDAPGAWLLQVARNRAIDRARHRALAQDRHAVLADAAGDAQAAADAATDDALDDAIGDDLLRLVFIACHPVLAPEARVALTLRLLGGLSTPEIARAFLTPEPTIAQRIVRAKRQLAEARTPFEAPRRQELPERLPAVLAVVYLVFNEGYAASAGDDVLRPRLCEEAMRLGRILAGLLPREPEVHGLLALMELQASRFPARTGPDGLPVLLTEQDRARWDRLLIGRGLEGLGRATRLAPARGPYALQAAIAACHARAPSAADTDWSAIAGLYAELMQVAPSPVVELNRAMAVAMARGPAAGLAIAESLRDAPALRGYHLLPAVRGDLLARLGRADEARAAFSEAAALAGNARERALLERRARDA
jgi:RNA polymerase sigma factor (sigma-70 family)